MNIPHILTDHGIEAMIMAHRPDQDQEMLANKLRALQVMATMRLVRENSDAVVREHRMSIAKAMRKRARNLPDDIAQVIEGLVDDIVMGLYEKPEP